MAASAVVTAYVLLGRSPMWNPWLRPALVGAGVLALATIVVLVARLSRRGVSAAGALATMVSLIGPAAYSIQTMATSHTGAIVSAGPVTANGSFGGPRPSAPMPPPVERPLPPSGVMLVPQFLSAETAPACRRVTVEARVASRARGPETGQCPRR